MTATTPAPAPCSRWADAHAAEAALALLLPAIEPLVARADVCGTGCLCVVVLDPGRPWGTCTLDEAVLLERAVGRPRAQWDADYAAYARAKAALSWRTGLHGSVVLSASPHRLTWRDQALPGAVCLDGIVVATSGAQPWWDEMFSLWVAAALRGLAQCAAST